MSGYILALLTIGALTILILIITAIIVVWRRGPESGDTFPILDARDEQRMMFYMNDGIGEIFAGLIILMFGVSLLSEMIWMSGVFIAIFVPLYMSAKRSYTAPRLQQLEDKSPRLGGLATLLFVFFLLGILSLIAALVLFGALRGENLPPFIGDVLNNYSWALAGGFAAILWTMAAYITDVSRFYGYAVLFLGVLSIGMLAGFNLPLLVAGLGGIVLGIGLIVLMRFIGQNPLRSET